MALTGVADAAYRATAVEAALAGSDGSPAALAAAAEHAADGQTRERRHPRRPRLSIAYGGRLHASRDRNGARAPLRLIDRPERGARRRGHARPPRAARLAGAILARDLTIGETRWPKGRRLSEDDLLALAAAPAGDAVTVLIADAGELHEDDAALRLARAVIGPNLDVRGRSEPDRPRRRGRGCRQRASRGPGATESTRSARGVHGVRRPGRGARRSRGQRQDRTPCGGREDRGSRGTSERVRQ
ncbi:MAG: hypothetical protein WKF78_13150 [Candidatus Limnocylindrales bacterium]